MPRRPRHALAGGPVADGRYALRLLGRDRAFAAVAIVALGLGIGVNNTQFTIVEGYCLRGLPVARADRVVFIGTATRRRGDTVMSLADFIDIRPRRDDVEASRRPPASDPRVARRRRSGRRQRDAAFISASTLRHRGHPPPLGRDSQDEDASPGAPVAVLLSTASGSRAKTGHPADRRPRRSHRRRPGVVVGVIPDGFIVSGSCRIGLPLEQMPGLRQARRDARTLRMFAAPARGVALAQAHTELDAIGGGSRRSFPRRNADIMPSAQSINAHYNGRSPTRLDAFTLVGVLVVVIACANVTNLMLMRSAVRAREIAMRSALGATRGRIVRPAARRERGARDARRPLGLALSVIGVRLFIHAIPARRFRSTAFGQCAVLAVLSAVTLGTVLLSGLLPAFSAVPTDIDGALKTGGSRWPTTAASADGRSAFLTVEFGLTVLLVSAVGLSLAELSRRREAPPKRIERAHLTFRLAPAPARYGTAARTRGAVRAPPRPPDGASLRLLVCVHAVICPSGGRAAAASSSVGRRGAGPVAEKRPVVWHAPRSIPGFFSHGGPLPLAARHAVRLLTSWRAGDGRRHRQRALPVPSALAHRDPDWPAHSPRPGSGGPHVSRHG